MRCSMAMELTDCSMHGSENLILSTLSIDFGNYLNLIILQIRISGKLILNSIVQLPGNYAQRCVSGVYLFLVTNDELFSIIHSIK